ncbi:MAG: RNA polymerase-binding protein DksA [Nitrospirae bacterium]|nr:RNA polymerase-binding protein DksA [Nitrospirota bacterium]
MKKTKEKLKKVAPVKKSTKPTKKKKILTIREKKIGEIKKKLLAQRKALLAEAIAALNELPEKTVYPDLGDQASAEIDRNFMLRLRGRERKLLKKIEEALDRIKLGTFGICDKCGQEIDIRRLDARPVTTMCIECKTLQEEEEKLMEV